MDSETNLSPCPLRHARNFFSLSSEDIVIITPQESIKKLSTEGWHVGRSIFLKLPGSVYVFIMACMQHVKPSSK